MNYKKEKQYRLPGYDYSSPGNYFITINTKDKIEFFGEIVDGEMVLNETGKIIKEEWLKLKNRFPIELDEFVIMPNHFHGIVFLRGENFVGECLRGRNLINQIPTMFKSKINNNPMETKDVTLGYVIRYFKGKVSFVIHRSNPRLNFKWQSRFYDRVVRTEKELSKIRKYIRENPFKWDIEKKI